GFAPVCDLAHISVDEEQDASYKQEETPRYHARDVAVMRAKMANAVVVLGSATPSLESYFNAKKQKYTLLELPDRVEKRPLPEVAIIDMRQEFQETGREHVISRRLAAEIQERLERKEQMMVLLNRRGYSPLVLCRACGKTLECRDCAIALTHHKRSRRMECHYCGHMAPVPKACVHCGSEYVHFLGTGSEKRGELCCRPTFPITMQYNVQRCTTSSAFTNRSCAFAAGCIIRRTAHWQMYCCAATSWITRCAGQVCWDNGSTRRGMRASVFLGR